MVTLYDMIPLMNPKLYLDPDPRYREFYHGKLEQLSRADALVAISESSAREAHEVAGFPQSASSICLLPATRCSVRWIRWTPGAF